LCDQIVVQNRCVSGLSQQWRETTFQSPKANGEWCAKIRAAERVARLLIVRAGKIGAVGPAGIYAKAVAVRHAGNHAAVLAKSLANDLLECAELRKILCPVPIESY
jgi:hypothetical protein